MLDGAGYRFRPDLGETMFRLPGYPLFLCALWWAFGIKLWVVQFSQALLAAATCWLIFHMGKRYWGLTVGLLAGLAFALWPIDWVVCARYSTEPLYTFLLTAAIAFLLSLTNQPRIAMAAALGAVMGVASLVREVNFLLALALCAGVPLLPSSRGKRLRTSVTMVVALLVVVLAMVPWVGRGYSLSGTIALPTTGTGLNLFSMTCLPRTADFRGSLRDLMREKIDPEVHRIIAARGIQDMGGDFDSPDYWTFRSIGDEVHANSILKQEAAESIRQDPWGVVGTVARNLGAFWFRGWTSSMTIAALLLHIPILLLGTIGAVVAVRRGENAAWVLMVVLVLLNAAYSLGVAQIRYSLPAIPFLLLLAARGLSTLLAASWLRPHGSTAHVLEDTCRRESSVTAPPVSGHHA